MIHFGSHCTRTITTTTARAATRKGPQVYFISGAPPPTHKMPLKASIEIQVFSLSFYNLAMNFYGHLYVKNTTLLMARALRMDLNKYMSQIESIYNLGRWRRKR